MKKYLFIFALLLSFMSFSQAKLKPKANVNRAPPAYNLVYNSLKDSPTWRNVVLEVAFRVANEKYSQYYQSGDPNDKKRTAFAKRILSFKAGSNDAILTDIVNQVTNSNVISDLDDPFNTVDNIYAKLSNEYDLIANIVP
jgi:hypothetical protein